MTRPASILTALMAPRAFLRTACGDPTHWAAGAGVAFIVLRQSFRAH